MAVILSDCRMVLLKTTLFGVSLLVVGILLLTVMGQYVTVQVQDIKRRNIEPHVEFLVGDLADRTYSFPATVSVLGAIDVTQAPTNQSGDIHFIIYDAENYQRWSSGGQSASLFSAEKQGHFNFTFQTNKNGVYHLLFDNRASPFKKYVILIVGYDEVSIRHVPDPRIPYIGWTLLAIGILLSAYGLLRKPPIPWA